MANVIIRWHKLLGMQQHIQNFVGKIGHLLLGNQKVIFKLAWYKKLMLKKHSLTLNNYYLSEHSLSFHLLSLIVLNVT